MEPRLLIEYRQFSYDPKIVTEAVNAGSPIVLSGIFQEAGSVNQNGRIYPREILEREVQKFQSMIKENRAYGALDHPESSIVELGNAAILVKELGWNGNQVVGKLQVLETTKGKDLQAILKAGGSVGVSSRAFGSTRPTNEGHEVVNEDLSLITWDVVANPSVTEAILTESYDLSKKYFFNPRVDQKIIVETILDKIIREL